VSPHAPDPARAAIEVAHDAYVSLDDQGRIRDWNAQAEELFGYSRAEAIGADAGELIVPERYRERHRIALRELFEAASRELAAREPVVRRRMHLRAIRRDGGEFPVDVSAIVARGELDAWVADMSERAALLGEVQALLRRGSPGFAQVFDALAEAVTIRDRNNHIIYANRAAWEQMGFGSLDELQARPPQSIMDDYLVTDESGAELSMADVPSVKLLSGSEAPPLVIRTIHRRTGEVRWEVLKATGLRDSRGEMFASVMVIEDITREKRAELRDRFLARASATLMSSLDYEETLRNVAWLAVPEIADWCAVDLVDAAGERQHVVVAHRDPEKLALAERLRVYEPDDPQSEQGIGRVMRTGTAELIPEVTDEMLLAGARDEEHLELLRAVGFRSVLLVPLRARGRPVGAMTLVTAESLRRFDDSDREFAEQLATRASVAVDNARLATARRAIAQTLQRSLLPEVVPAIEGWQIATLYRAADAAEEVEVGGDFYDFLPTEAGWIVLIGDVTGKGVEAAAMTSLVRHGARFLSRYEDSPSRILAGLNDALRERPGLSLCTALCVRLEAERVTICSAGHPPPLIVRDDGRVREIGGPGPILGAWTGQVSPDRPAAISSDETVVLYTDGVIDTRGASGRFGARRLRRLLAEHAGEAPEAMLAALESELAKFSVAEQADDTAAVALRSVPVPSEASVQPAAEGVF
jgi:PAS domain S-box-containing protein